MKKTIVAQLGGENRPIRIEKEKHFNLKIAKDSSNIKSYSINKSINYNSTLPIELSPQQENEFKSELLKKRIAHITIYYENGDKEIKPWKANRFKENSDVLGNLRSRKEFRKGEWQSRGIIKVLVSINN
ncbi:MAG: hypothetical protein COA67_00995 [Lutibacter sp.]|nr:MAG: hypothetical protein COA67_00995 [Lutibacter sp.]